MRRIETVGKGHDLISPSVAVIVDEQRYLVDTRLRQKYFAGRRDRHPARVIQALREHRHRISLGCDGRLAGLARNNLGAVGGAWGDERRRQLAGTDVESLSRFVGWRLRPGRCEHQNR
ncbi:MAG: hypothetical protein GKS00_02695 [Alphaproteobacteria bacterium]|nr:hypothetical protein [Alphaproteobacteria bacterium]